MTDDIDLILMIIGIIFLIIALINTKKIIALCDPKININVYNKLIVKAVLIYFFIFSYLVCTCIIVFENDFYHNLLLSTILSTVFFFSALYVLISTLVDKSVLKKILYIIQNLEKLVSTRTKEINTKNKQLKQMLKKIKKISEIDALTGIYNRGACNNYLKLEFMRYTRYQHPATIAMIDIDKFKQINDKYGHQAGDVVLQNFANILKNTVRKADIVCRYGGDEFIIILPDTNASMASKLINRINKIIFKKLIIQYQSNIIKYSVSIGVATIDSSSYKQYEDWLNSADLNLYKYKANHNNSAII